METGNWRIEIRKMDFDFQRVGFRFSSFQFRNEGAMVKDGYWYALPLVLVAAGLVGFGHYWPGWYFWLGGCFFLVLAALVLYFFRDPEREIPTDPNAIISPADGRVVEIRDDDFEGRSMRRVSIFMSPLDVHVNRSPIAGTIRAVSYHPGSFRIATEARASVENEQNVFTVTGDQGVVVTKQIAGAVARRIVFWKKPGDAVARGERVGLIKFGSRVDVLMEPGIEMRVKVGDRVRAAASILASSQQSEEVGTTNSIS
jgi:phosphatidylserine decarboxylase